MDTMKNCMPEAYKELVENCEILERQYKDMMVKLYISFGTFFLSSYYPFFFLISEEIKAFVFSTVRHKSVIPSSHFTC